MKFFFAKIFFIFLFVGISNANENIKFININYIVNNSEAGKTLNKIIENKSKKITSELDDLGKKIQSKKEKIISQKNILKKDEYEKLVKNYEDEVKKYNSIRLKKNEDFNKYRINSQKKINPNYESFIYISGGVLSSILPFLPNGNFFNNYMLIMFFLMFSIYLFYKKKLKIDEN